MIPDLTHSQIEALLAWLEDAKENEFSLDDLISTLRDVSEGEPVEA